MPKILRITTVPISINILLRGQLKFMTSQGFTVFTASANGTDINEIKVREKVEHFTIDFTRKISPFKDIKALVQTITLINKIKPDIVHTHTPKAGLIGMIASWWCRVPIRMHTVAGMPLMEAKGVTRYLLVIAEKITVRCATNIYPNSFRLKSWMASNFPKSNGKLRVLANGSSNGIDTNYFNIDQNIESKGNCLKNKYHIPDEAKVLIFVGRLVRDKGVHELVAAFNKVINVYKEPVYLIMVGDYENQRNPVSEEVKEIIERSNNIISVGFQTDIRPYLAMSDIFVFPSYREGFPNVVMQAACFNLPCIVSDINGCNEIISHEYNGLLVKPKEVNGLAEAILRFLTDENLRMANSKVVRKAIVEKYSQNLVWDAILKEYQRLLR